jgi:hypothetical protein
MASLTSFQANIRPLFTERHIDAMSKAFDLRNYNDVKAHAAIIYDRIRGIGGAVILRTPPRGEARGLKLGFNCSPNGWRTSINPKKGSYPCRADRISVLN